MCSFDSCFSLRTFDLLMLPEWIYYFKDYFALLNNSWENVIPFRLKREAYKCNDEGLISDMAYIYWFTAILSPVRLIFSLLI